MKYLTFVSVSAIVFVGASSMAQAEPVRFAGSKVIEGARYVIEGNDAGAFEMAEAGAAARADLRSKIIADKAALQKDKQQLHEDRKVERTERLEKRRDHIQQRLDKEKSHPAPSNDNG